MGARFLVEKDLEEHNIPRVMEDRKILEEQWVQGPVVVADKQLVALALVEVEDKQPVALALVEVADKQLVVGEGHILSLVAVALSLELLWLWVVR